MNAPSHFLVPLLRRTNRPLALRNGRDGRSVADTLESAFDSSSRRQGLLGREEIPEGTALIIAPCSAVHTVGMQFPIDVIFATKDGCVVKTRSRVPPWRMAGAFRSFAAIELRAGSLEQSGVQPGDRLEIAE